MKGQRGLTFAEVLVASLIGSVVILALGSLYLATTRAFAVSESQATLQRQGQLALDEIAFQVRRASQVRRIDATSACPPAGSNGPSLWVRVEPLPDRPPADPEWRDGDYCFYAGTGDNEAVAGALCERYTPTGGAAGPCRNLLGGGGSAAGGGAALGLIREAVPLGIRLVLQTEPPDARCDIAALPDAGLETAELPGNDQFCFVAGDPPSSQSPSTTVAFAINDQINALTFGITLMLRNVRD